MLKAFKECSKRGQGVIYQVNTGIITALRRYEKRLNMLGYDFTVVYDRLKKQAIIYSTDIIKVSGKRVYFNLFGAYLVRKQF